MGVLRNSSFYEIVLGPTWDDAEVNAVSLGGHLVTVNDASEHSWIASEFSKEKYYYSGDSNPGDPETWTHFWLGGTDKNVEGTWEWVSGENWSFDGWIPGLPNNVGAGGYDYLAGIFNVTAGFGQGPGTYYWDDGKSPYGTANFRGIAEVPLSYFSISDATITEGDSGNITISRTGGSNTVQNLTLASSNGTALAGTDYTAINQTVTFAKGETSKTISIASIEDSTFELNETFILNLTASSADSVPAQITDGSALITINNDDNFTQKEGIYGSSFYTFVNGPNWLDAEANALAMGGNLAVITSSGENEFITQLMGEANVYNSAFIGFKNSNWITGESISYSNWHPDVEGNKNHYFTNYPYSEIWAPSAELIKESWQVNIRGGVWNTSLNDQGRDQKGIAEVPLSYFSISDATITEGDSGNITISRTGGSNTVQNLTLASSNGTALAGTDYTAINQTVTFAKGETSKTVSISSIEDTTTESDETFSLTLTASSTDTVPAQISDNSATIKIEDDDPTYVINPSASTINEGETLTTSILTTNVTADTTLYYSLSGTGITSNDFSSGSLTGSGTVDSDGYFSFSHFLANDITTEGNETLNIKLFSDSSRSTQVGSTSTVTINDTSLTQTYTITKTTINEGEALPSVLITNVATNTNYYYFLSGTGITTADFSVPIELLTGSGTVDSNNTLSFQHILSADGTTEGDETLRIELFSIAPYSQTNWRDSLITTLETTITDTSKTPSSYTISPSATSIKEGETLTTSISTTNVAADTTLYWSLSGTGITSSDFSSGALTGSGTVDSNGDFSFAHTLASDATTEGNETLNIKLFSDSTRSTQVGTTSVVSITDTSKTSVVITGPNGPIPNPDEVNSDISIAENNKNIFTFTANLPVTWSVAAWPGNEGEEDFFTIDSSSGLLSFKNAPDYENPLDIKKQNSYDVLVVATHSNGTDSYQAVDVTITDIDEPTYTITPSLSPVTEGSNLTTDISTTNVAEGTTIYWKLSGNGIKDADFTSGALTGSGTVDSNGNFSFSHTIADDNLTEGDEKLKIKLYSDSARTTQLGKTKRVTITDTSKTPTYTISPSTTSINEGETLTTSISTTNVAADTKLYYSLSGTGITSADFSSGSLTGSGTVDSNGDFSFAHTLASDATTEGNETLNIKLFSDSTRSTQVGTTSVVSITDTSKTPTYTISPSTTSINEGETLTTSISTTNVAADTKLYYSLSGTGITSADFSSGALTGSGTVDSNGDFSFSHTLAKDLLNEGDETLEIKLFSDSARSTQVGATKSITITGGSTIYTLSTDSPSAIEADTNTKVLTYTLTLDQAATENTNINYETLTTGTATSGEDFVKAAGVITFLEGQKVATLNITINGDLLLEEDETVKVKFSSSKLKEEIIATGTITNNDKGASIYKASVDNPSLTEPDSGTKTLAYTITLDQEATEATTINYQTLTSGTATTGEDFVTAAGVVTFAKGQKVATLNISVNGDANVESDETIQVKFSGAALSSEVIATGTIKNNDIAGSDNDEVLNGSTENDNLKGGGGADVIDGGAGVDTVTYTGQFNDYTITKTTTTIQISDIRVTSPDGVDTVQNIEYVQFTDQLVAADKVNVVKAYSGNFRDYKFYNKGDGNYEIKDTSGSTDDITGIPKLTFADKTGDESVSAIADIKGVFDQVTGKETASGEMFRLYNAAFARFPDSDGLKYWINNFSSGIDDQRAVSSSFLSSAEFKERYGNNITHETYVQNLYLNVLNRELDQSGYDYWVGNLNNGVEQRHEVLLGFAESAENKTLFTEMTGLG